MGTVTGEREFGVRDLSHARTMIACQPISDHPAENRRQDFPMQAGIITTHRRSRIQNTQHHHQHNRHRQSVIAYSTSQTRRAANHRANK